MKKVKISAVVVVYHPQIEQLKDNLSNYDKMVSHIIVVDNSEDTMCKQHLLALCKEKRYKYIDMFGNKGIALALKIGIHNIISTGDCDWVLTMDQDSCFQTDITGFTDFIKMCADIKEYIFLAPSYSYNSHVAQVNDKILYPRFVWQSGCLIQICNYLKLGPYLDKLFIDYVDYEYCLRARKNGFKFAQLTSVVLKHNPGEPQDASFLGFKYQYHSSFPIRHYYYVRNGLYVIFRYKSFRCIYFLLKSILKVLFIENDKKSKIHFMSKGMLDFKENRYGRFSD